MRVANFTDTYLPRRDGVITSLRTLVAELRARGHGALVVVPRHPDQGPEEDVMRLRAVPCGVADLRLSPWLLRGAAADRPFFSSLHPATTAANNVHQTQYLIAQLLFRIRLG